MKSSIIWISALILVSLTFACGEGDHEKPPMESGVAPSMQANGKADLYGESGRTGYPWEGDHDFASDDDVDNTRSESEQATIDRFLSLDAGEASEFDLTNGEILIAGPVQGLTAVLGCAEGSLYVAAGALTGALATTVAASGAVAGPTVVATSSASVPIFAAAGGLFGLAVSGGAWSKCAAGLAQLGTALYDAGGYDSTVRGLQLAIRGTNSQANSTDRDTSIAATITCSQATYDRLRQRKKSWCGSRDKPRSCHDNSLLGRTGADCGEIQRRITNGSQCVDARKEINNACFGGLGHPDENGVRGEGDDAVNRAIDAVNYCIDIFNRLCGS